MNTCDRRARSAALSSNGIGHKFVHPPPFHTSNGLKNGPLPLSLHCRSHISVASSFIPISHAEHNRKPLTGPLADIKYPLAPPHWRTHTMTDLKQRIENCWALRVVSSPISETRDKYRGQPTHIRLSIRPPTAPYCNELATVYENLATDLTMTAPGPLLSTTYRDNRLFNSELTSSYFGLGNPPPEGITKSSAYSHISAHKVPSTASCYPRLSRRTMPVPYGAYSSQYRDSFTTPALPRTLSHQVQPQHVSK